MSEDLSDASSIWKFLDNMHARDPKEYRQFIDGVMKDGEANNLGPPVTHFVLQTEKVPIMIPQRKYFVNIVKWIQVPKPSAGGPISIVSSAPRKHLVDKEWAMIIDVALNPDVFAAEPEDSVIELALRYLENKNAFKLSREYTRLDSKYVGNEDSLLDFMCPSFKDKLSSIVQNDDTRLINEIKNADDKSLLSDTILSQKSTSFEQPKLPKTKSKDGVELREVKTRRKDAGKRTPKVEMEINKEKACVEVTVYLPGVKGVAECDLLITESELSLEVANKFDLVLPFPVDIIVDETSAKFVKDEQVLLVKSPIVHSTTTLDLTASDSSLTTSDESIITTPSISSDDSSAVLVSQSTSENSFDSSMLIDGSISSSSSVRLSSDTSYDMLSPDLSRLSVKQLSPLADRNNNSTKKDDSQNDVTSIADDSSLYF